VVRPEVELIVVAGEIPDHITADLSGRNIGDVIHISDIPLPEGAKPTIDRDFVVANITAPSGLVSSDNASGGDEDDGEEAGAEPKADPAGRRARRARDIRGRHGPRGVAALFVRRTAQPASPLFFHTRRNPRILPRDTAGS
jgi:hypothetical protein